MRVSIIIPCYNTERWIAEAIQSALSQTYEVAEIIVVDDGSSDNSLDEIKKFSGVIAVSQKNGGPSAARNEGLVHATGEYVVFLDADDRLKPDAVARHVEVFEKNPGVSMVYGSINLIDEHGIIIGNNIQSPSIFDWREVIFGKTPSSSQAMFHRDTLRSIGNFNMDLRIGEDFPVYLNLARRADIVCHGALVAEYRKHPGQLTKCPAALLEAMMGSLRLFRSEFDEEIQKERIWSEAERHWQIYWGQWIPGEIVKCAMRRDWDRLGASFLTYLRYMPDTLVGSYRYGMEKIFGQ